MQKLTILTRYSSGIGFFAPGIVGNIGAQWNIGQHFALSLDYRLGIHYQIGSQWLHSAYNVGLGIKYRW